MKKYTTLATLLLVIVGNLTLHAQNISMRVPDSTVSLGNTIDLPIYADNTLTGRNVLAYTFQLTFNQTVYQFISVVTAGTISAPYGSPAVNSTVPGQVTFAGAGATALAGSGKFIYLRFKALIPGGSSIAFTGATYNYFNEGLPAMNFHNGSINTPSPPAITVYPNTGTITKGETLQFGVSGGTAPYQWFVTSPSVASINSSGLLTGIQAGFTKVVAVDNGGLRDTSNSPIEIRAMRLTIPGNLSQWQGSDIDVPVNTSDLTGLNIFSGNFSVDFNQNILTPFDVVQAGTLLASYPAPVFNPGTPGTVSVDFAGVTPLSGSGTLIYIRFHVSAITTGGTQMTFSSGLFNENLPPNFTNGFFSTINLPVLSITPNAGTLVAGQTKQFTLNGGGTPPIVWSVSNPLVASVTQAGLMTTLTGGNVTVTATDFHGATATTGNWLVYDTQVIMPDTTTCPAATEFYYPILIRSLPPGESVYAVQATVTYNSTYLTFLNMETNGTLTQGWTFVSNPSSGQITFAGSGTTSFNTSGKIVMLKFGFKPAFVLGSNAGLQLPSITLNEGTPNPLADLNGSIVAANITLPVSVSVTASANPVVSGTPVTFTAAPVNGGAIPSYQWKVNSIPIAGAINHTYTYAPTDNDAITCVVTSNGMCITGNPATSVPVVMTVTAVPANITVTGSVAATNCYNATSTLTVAGGVTTFSVLNGGSATLIAGVSIDFLPGSRVYPGGYLHGYIAPGGPWCATGPVPSVATGSDQLTMNPAPQLFKAYPNPTTEAFTLELAPGAASGQVNVEIFGLQGMRILSVNLKDEPKHLFSTGSWPAGIYFLRVISGDRAETMKIVRQ